MKKKISLKKVGLLVLLIISVGIVLHDIAILFSGASFTWFGLITFIAAIYVATDIVSYFKGF